jgi:hypothetical protein
LKEVQIKKIVERGKGFMYNKGWFRANFPLFVTSLPKLKFLIPMVDFAPPPLSAFSQVTPMVLIINYSGDQIKKNEFCVWG